MLARILFILHVALCKDAREPKLVRDSVVLDCFVVIRCKSLFIVVNNLQLYLRQRNAVLGSRSVIRRNIKQILKSKRSCDECRFAYALSKTTDRLVNARTANGQGEEE